MSRRSRPDDGPPVEDLSARLVAFVTALRAKGIPAGPSESIDAARVAEVLGFDDREQLREGLAAALVRRGGQRDAFDMTFDLFFPLGAGRPQAALDHDAEAGPDAPADEMTQDLRDLLAMALAERDVRTMRQIAELAVDALGEVGQPGTQTEGWSAHQTLDRLAPQTLIAQVMSMRAAAGQGGEGGTSGPPGTGAGDVTERLMRDETRRDVQTFRELVQGEARRRTAESRGRERVARHAVPSDGNRIDFLSASRDELAQLRATVRPLSRKLATRLTVKRRRAHRGRIDVRRTVRRSMGTGGVPLKPAYAPPHPARPDLVLLCDVSGSVAGFSEFTMLLVQALSDQFSRVRTFAFVNAMAEVTDLVRESRPEDLSERIKAEARLTHWHTSSDYGTAFGDFVDDYLDAIGPRTSVVILGDGRNNNQASNVGALAMIERRAKRAFWLNPESSGQWGLGDSVAPEYGDVVSMHQCSNVDQLTRFVTRLLPV